MDRLKPINKDHIVESKDNHKGNVMTNIPKPIDSLLPDLPEYKPPIALWFRNYQTRKALNDMEAHRLLDIGIDKAQAETESRKSFWR